MIRTTLAIAATCAPWTGLACNLDGSTAKATRTLHGAEVILRNNLARATMNEVQCVFAMPPHGAIQVIWTHAPGDAPDTAIIIPPPGFAAIPPEATIAEHGSIVVLIVPEVMG
jgi:hypothetical protein